MTIQLNMIRDDAGRPTYGLPFSDDLYRTVLVGNVEETLTVPSKSSFYLAIFSFEPGSTVWVAVNSIVTLPGAGFFQTTNAELNPIARAVKAKDILHFITGDTSAPTGVAFYAFQR